MVSYGNSRFECYENGRKEATWTWVGPERVIYLQTFKAIDCPLTEKLDGYVLLLISGHANFYLLSSAAGPEEAMLSLSLPVTLAFLYILTLQVQNIFYYVRRTIWYSSAAVQKGCLYPQTESTTEQFSANKQVR